MDMNYRGMINLLVFCSCVGQSGGGWLRYVGQEAPVDRRTAAGVRRTGRPPRRVNSTSYFYNHASQWRCN
ncbi:molybdopterin-dependent oxidoreductase [Klebsiella pneumoniae]|nr:molybdopterin-dependent oxidoreductase [Klebsiella pneumoniae]